MLYLILSVALQAALVAHVIKTGRNFLWIWALLFLPGIGSLAYILVEILPELFGSRTARSAARGVRRAIDPNRDLRNASVHASVTDSVATKAALAAEQSRRGDYAAAIETYKSGLRGLYEFDPTLLIGLAQAQFAAGDAVGARTTLDALNTHNAAFKTADTQLLYARALEAEGNTARAELEYRAIAAYYPGAEAKVRCAQFLRNIGHVDEANAMLDDVLRTAELAPRHVRRAQAEWLSLAQRERART